MKKYFLILSLILFSSNALAELKGKIIQNLSDTDNFSFDFEQNINGKIEKGNCKVKYPKKIYCNYHASNQKILVSNGKWLIIKTTASYYKYPLDKTPLNYLLDKNFLIKRINDLNQRVIQEKLINFNFVEKENEINIFFDITNHNLVGWQTLDIYQNLSITYLNSITINQKLKENLFKLPERN